MHAGEHSVTVLFSFIFFRRSLMIIRSRTSMDYVLTLSQNNLTSGNAT